MAAPWVKVPRDMHPLVKSAEDEDDFQVVGFRLGRRNRRRRQG